MSGLEDDPFDWRIGKDGLVMIYRGGRQVVVVGGSRGHRLAAQLDATGAEPGGGYDEAAQQLLARATGNYRRGNEKRPTR